MSEPQIEIKRISQNSSHPTMGVILNHGLPFALTLELPWRGNQKSISCIPEGEYKCQRVQSPRFGDTFEVIGVPGRSHILFHKGNIDDDTHGCIILGEQFEYLQGEEAVLSSSHAIKEFYKITDSVDEFALKISDHYSGG